MQARSPCYDCFLVSFSVLLPSSNLGAAFDSIPEMPFLVWCLGDSSYNGVGRAVVGEFPYPRVA